MQSDNRQNADCTFFTTLSTSNRFSLTAIESPGQSGVADDLIELVFVSDDVKKAKKCWNKMVFELVSILSEAEKCAEKPTHFFETTPSGIS